MQQSNAPLEQQAPPAIEVTPVTDIAYAKVDLNGIINPVPAILGSAEFAATKKFFAESPSAERSLLPDTAQALLYTIARNFQPHHVVEIGTYKGGTAEVLARAVQANGFGTLHTGSPFDSSRFVPVYHGWPEILRRQVRYYQVDSMALYIRLDSQKIKPGLVFIDGNHDFEFVTFDLQATARRLVRGGFIFLSTVSQAGPYLAAMDFMAAHPEWHDCSARSPTRDDTKAVDAGRTHIDGADLIILRAPFNHFVGNRPETMGAIDWSSSGVKGIRLSIAGPTKAGTLHIQCFLRAFSEGGIAEVVGHGERVIDGTSKQVEIVFDRPLTTNEGYDRYHVEPWLVWQGDSPLPLSAAPEPF